MTLAPPSFLQVTFTLDATNHLLVQVRDLDYQRQLQWEGTAGAGIVGHIAPDSGATEDP